MVNVVDALAEAEHLEAEFTELLTALLDDETLTDDEPLLDDETLLDDEILLDDETLEEDFELVLTELVELFTDVVGRVEVLVLLDVAFTVTVLPLLLLLLCRA